MSVVNEDSLSSACVAHDVSSCSVKRSLRSSGEKRGRLLMPLLLLLLVVASTTTPLRLCLLIYKKQ